jgi:hypothetical protein
MSAQAPLRALIEAHVLSAERLHGDDTTLPIPAKSKTVTASRAAAMTTLTATAKLNDIDQLTWLPDVLARIADIQQGLLRNCCHGRGRRPACERPFDDKEPRPERRTERTICAYTSRPWW